MSPQVTRFEALTGAIGEALALFGGARQTRLTAQASPGDTSLACERVEGLPVPGQVSVGRVTYRYSRVQGRVLGGVAAVIGGSVVAGVVASHPVGATVLDTSGAYSELDTLRRGLFLDTAEGQDLANLGRSLGVLRSPSLSSDDQYREVVKALAYARRGTVKALSDLLDALLGPGKYELHEDPFTSPGKVIVGVDYGSTRQVTNLGRTYVSDPAPVVATGGAFPQALPAFGHGALKLAPLSVEQDFAAARPSAAAPAALWGWRGSDEASQVTFTQPPEGPGKVATLAGLQAAYGADPDILTDRAQARLSLLLRVVNPTLLAPDARRMAIQLHDGQRLARLGGRATATGWQVAFIDQTGVALSAWVAAPLSFATLSVSLGRRGATLSIGASVALEVPRASLPAPQAQEPRAAFGNLLGGGQPQAVMLQVRQAMCHVTHPDDWWLGRGAGATCAAGGKVTLPGASLPARAVGRALWLSGAASQARGRGRFEVTAAAGATATVQGTARSGGQLVDGNPTAYFLAPKSAPFTYPDDLGRAVVVTSGGSQVAGSYTIAALYDPTTGVDLAGLLTPGLSATAVKARLAGGRVVSAAGLLWRVDPVFSGQGPLDWLLEDPGEAAVSAGVQTLTPWQALPKAGAPYVFPRRRVLGGVVRSRSDTYNRVADDGPPVRLKTNPFYATSHLAALENYLPGAAGAGTTVAVTYR